MHLVSYGSDFPADLFGGSLTGGETGTPVSSGQNQQYACDNCGNLPQMSGTSVFSQPSNKNNLVAAYQYNAGGRLLSDGFHNDTYDSNGMLLTISDGNSYNYVAGLFALTGRTKNRRQRRLVRSGFAAKNAPAGQRQIRTHIRR